MNVYLAGKIEANGWRERIFSARNVEWFEQKPDSWEPVFIDNSEERFGKRIFVTGPFFISCDHGCAHGGMSHGAGLSGIVCLGDDSAPSREQVTGLCMRAIDRCDFFFAWIDSPDAFGTFFEIGYAYAKNKDVFLCYSEDASSNPNDSFWSESWFMRKAFGVKEFTAKSPEDGIKQMIQSIWGGPFDV